MDGQTVADERNENLHDEEDDIEFPPLKIVLPTMGAIWLVFFLVALDRTIIGTAIPTISKEFNSFGDIAWYEAGFLLPVCVFQLSFGQIYKYYSTKWVLLINTVIFELGSIVCAAAPTSAALIVGRVVTGIGAAGIGSGAFLIIRYLVPKDQVPKYTGSLGSVFGITSILGPVLGGYLTSITWRWCFWINLPVGGVALVVFAILTPKIPPAVKPASTWKGKFLDLDPLGFIFIGPSLICLILAVEFGGVRYPWNSGTIIALFILFGVLLICFIGAQMWRGKESSVPGHILFQRTIFLCCIASIGIGAGLILFSFYLPIWFQVVQGKSTEKSGLSLIPELLSVVFAVIASGILVTTIGYYTPTFIIGATIMIVGGGLISTWTPDVSAGKWIGYQIIEGIGLGLTLQAPIIASQNVLSRAEGPTGLALMNIFTSVGGTIFVPVAQTLLETTLAKKIKPILPDIDPHVLAGQGAGSIRTMVRPDQLPEVLKLYNDALKTVWYLTIGMSALVLIGALGTEFRSVKKDKAKEKNGESGEQGDVEMREEVTERVEVDQVKT